MNWKIGDVAICITPGSPMENTEVIILSNAFREPDKIDLVYQVDPGPPLSYYARWGAERWHLQPLPDPNTPSTWEECVFKPKELLVVRQQSWKDDHYVLRERPQERDD